MVRCHKRILVNIFGSNGLKLYPCVCVCHCCVCVCRVVDFQLSLYLGTSKSDVSQCSIVYDVVTLL